MAAPPIFERIRQDVELRLRGYVIRPTPRKAWRVARGCRTGESHSGLFTTEPQAEAFLMRKVPIPDGSAVPALSGPPATR